MQNLEYKIESELPNEGRGGQHVGMYSPGVTVTHIPTGLKAFARARSQHHSKTIAMEMIEWGLTHKNKLL